MRDLSGSELDEVSGGCFHFHHSSHSCASSSSLIGALAGLAAGLYNLEADLFNGATCSAVKSAVHNIASDVKLGFEMGASMTVSGAETLLSDTFSTIRSASSSMNLIAFPVAPANPFG